MVPQRLMARVHPPSPRPRPLVGTSRPTPSCVGNGPAVVGSPAVAGMPDTVTAPQGVDLPPPIIWPRRKQFTQWVTYLSRGVQLEAPRVVRQPSVDGGSHATESLSHDWSNLVWDGGLDQRRGVFIPRSTYNSPTSPLPTCRL